MSTYNLWLRATTILVLCCAFIFTACSDNDNNSDPQDVYTLTIEQAQKQAFQITLKSLQDENMEKTPFTHWTKGEKIEVYINHNIEGAYAQHIGTLMAQDDGISTVLKGQVDLKGYNIGNSFSSNETIPLLLVTSPTIDFNTQDGTLSTILNRFAHVVGDVQITGVNKETKELIHVSTDVFWNSGGLMSYTLRDAKGLPIKASHLIISCIDETGELFTRYADYTKAYTDGLYQQGAIDIELSTPSDVIYVCEKVPMEGFSDGNKPVHITAIADGEVYTASYKVFHIMDAENYKQVLVMEKR